MRALLDLSVASLLLVLCAVAPSAAHAQADVWPNARVAAGGQWSSASPERLDAAFSAEAGPRFMVQLDGRRDGRILHVAPGLGCLIVVGEGRHYTATGGLTLMIGGTTWGVGGRVQAMVGEVYGALGGGADVLARIEGFGFSLEVGGGIVANDEATWGTFRFAAGLDIPHLIGSFFTTFRQEWSNFDGLIRPRACAMLRVRCCSPSHRAVDGPHGGAGPRIAKSRSMPRDEILRDAILRDDGEAVPVSAPRAAHGREAEDREGSRLILSGLGLGAAGVASSVLLGATCPICVVGAPALVGWGAWRKWRARRFTDLEPSPDADEPEPT